MFKLKKKKKNEDIEEDPSGSIYCVHRQKELTSLKCPHYPKQSTDSAQFLLKYQCCISQTYNKHSKNLYGNTKDPK